MSAVLPSHLSTAPADDAVRADARLAWAREASGDATLTLVRASMDAGFRSYWRGEAHGLSRIVMDSPPGLEDVRPWLRIRDLLEMHGVRVPHVRARDVELGFLLLEDLGGATCLQTLETLDADALMDAAFEQLLRLQAIAPPDDLPAFDSAMLLRELALFDDWFLGRHLGVTLSFDERAGWESVQAHLIDAMLAQHQVLVHRDYMLRNLMPVEGGVAVLDFQDAVTGPIAYDVACLLRDAFHSWPAAQADAWLARYHARAQAVGLPAPALAQFFRDVALTGVQRHLKVMGIFARLHHRDSKPKYLADAPRFLAYLDAVVPLDPALAPLGVLLDRHVRPRFTAD
ncbi:aminoglycoside phosphotransferase family protein [Luteimonas terrae]|uniref:Aminoglycoside/choline kinase family phosphotransferase n=1 Tax=Luteimonas terrae TaxID=1530191 RepID=A0ABU1XUQ9_9GAMM|nr:phosphotransferase [Luteimonas terrae]MDR7191871.1 aminoglycoside/choline kinase family phosphotransferase [Luteimonas terrae]